MTPERWRKIEALYNAVLEREPQTRAAFLAEACQGDDELRATIDALLVQEGSALNHPAWEQFSSLAEDPAPTMALAPGAQLGPYRIEETLGAGGMGRVYKARDTRLDRYVAIKVLKQQFSGRFEREARAISSLNHPNICTLHDIGPNYLVMELVGGITLAERIKRGAVPLEEALDIARQIAGALETAHERGIVHRDLKPANIKITPDGTIKVLDFGLAKVARTSVSRGADATETMTVTEAGVVVGTPSYMAPEQARGQPVDKRADIWAFGVVLFEVLTGKRLFTGDTLSDTLAVVLTQEPAWNLVPPQTERLLRRCLEKDPKQRLRDIGDVRFLLDEEAPRQAAPASSSPVPWRIGAAALAAVLAVALFFLWTATHRAASAVLRLSVDLGENAALSPIKGTTMALSPDGSRIVFVTGQQFTKSQLALRRLDQSMAMPLAGTEGAEAPFFSPDGKSIGFFADGRLKKIDVAGGTPVTLCDAPSDREGSWGDDDNIVFAADNKEGLSRVPASGGTRQMITKVDNQRGEYSHRYPQVLPDARAVLFTNSPDAAGEGPIQAQFFDTGKPKTLIQSGGYGHYLSSGHLVYMHRGTLFAAPMNVDRLEITGPSVPVLEDVRFYPDTGTAGFTFSRSGMFVYVATSAGDTMRSIAMMDEKGKLEPLPIARDRFSTRPRISPDGLRVAVVIRDGPVSHIWIYEIRSGRFSRFPFAIGNSSFPVWSPDARRLLFFSDAATPGPGIYWMRADGAGEAHRVMDGLHLVPSCFASGRLIYELRKTNGGLWSIAVDWSEDARAKPAVPERFSGPGPEAPAAVSPDGRWLAYAGGKSGPQVMVQPISGPGGPWQISTGGAAAVWSANGRELFYLGRPQSRIMVVAYSVAGDSFSSSVPRAWNETLVESFDLMPDGKHAVVIPKAEQTEATHATFVLNFMDDLRRRVPAGK